VDIILKFDIILPDTQSKQQLLMTQLFKL